MNSRRLNRTPLGVPGSGFTLQVSGMGLFYVCVNVKALVTGSITKWSPWVTENAY
jgi:hypothetical protein